MDKKIVCQSAHHRIIDYGVDGYVLRQPRRDTLIEEDGLFTIADTDALAVPSGCVPPSVTVLQPVTLPSHASVVVEEEGFWYEDLRHRAFFEFKPKCGLPLPFPSRRYGSGMVWGEPCQMLLESCFQQRDPSADNSARNAATQLRKALRLLHNCRRVKWYENGGDIRAWIQEGVTENDDEQIVRMTELIGRTLRWLSCFIALSDGLETQASELLTMAKDHCTRIMLRHDVPGWLVPFLIKGVHDRLCLADLANIHARMARDADMLLQRPKGNDSWAESCALWLSAFMVGKVMSDCSLFVSPKHIYIIDTGPKIGIEAKIKQWHQRVMPTYDGNTSLLTS